MHLSPQRKKEETFHMSKQHSKADMFVIGFALFSMFFGAGNVIFPPFLGMGSGPSWGLGFTCYYIADIGLALVALFSIFRRGGSDGIVRPIGRIPANILMCAIVLCIGPMLAIPRTAAMTFEMSVQPLTSGIGSVLFSVIFFVVVFICSVRENSVVDIVGKILTPLLLLGLLILIVKGVISPLGEPSEVPFLGDTVAAEGIKAGYQTMDVLATMLFGVLILHSAESKGYHEHVEKRDVAIKSSLVAGVMLLVVYGGLTYLGSTVSRIYDMNIDRATLVLNIVRSLLGQHGTVLFAIVVALACLTTAVGLVSSCSQFFNELSHGRMPYSVLVTVICVFSAVVSNVGLEQLISIAAPVLDIVYPPTLVLIVLSFIPKLSNLSIRLAVVGAMVVSVLGAVSSYGGIPMKFLKALPLASLGFGWIVPAAVCCLIGFLIKRGPDAQEEPAA